MIFSFFFCKPTAAAVNEATPRAATNDDANIKLSVAIAQK